jgi:hypothetical protein
MSTSSTNPAYSPIDLTLDSPSSPSSNRLAVSAYPSPNSLLCHPTERIQSSSTIPYIVIESDDDDEPSPDTRPSGKGPTKAKAKLPLEGDPAELLPTVLQAWSKVIENEGREQEHETGGVDMVSSEFSAWVHRPSVN